MQPVRHLLALDRTQLIQLFLKLLEAFLGQELRWHGSVLTIEFASRSRDAIKALLCVLQRHAYYIMDLNRKQDFSVGEASRDSPTGSNWRMPVQNGEKAPEEPYYRTYVPFCREESK